MKFHYLFIIFFFNFASSVKENGHEIENLINHNYEYNNWNSFKFFEIIHSVKRIKEDVSYYLDDVIIDLKKRIKLEGLTRLQLPEYRAGYFQDNWFGTGISWKGECDFDGFLSGLENIERIPEPDVLIDVNGDIIISTEFLVQNLIIRYFTKLKFLRFTFRSNLIGILSQIKFDLVVRISSTSTTASTAESSNSIENSGILLEKIDIKNIEHLKNQSNDRVFEEFPNFLIESILKENSKKMTRMISKVLQKIFKSIAHSIVSTVPYPRKTTF